jgi:hypothetical protein
LWQRLGLGIADVWIAAVALAIATARDPCSGRTEPTTSP